MSAAAQTPKERPILMSAPMVQGLLEDRKTKTRRVVKPQPVVTPQGYWSWSPRRAQGLYHGQGGSVADLQATLPAYCPYGAPGDRLWVREAWRVQADVDMFSGSELGHDWPVQYEAGVWSPLQNGVRPDRSLTVDGPFQKRPGRYRHARFMPRWASRILLEITDVQVERLNEITEADAEAEGIKQYADGFHWEPNQGWPGEPAGLESARLVGRTAIAAYRALWESINGPGSWDENPWVWAVEFKKVTP